MAPFPFTHELLRCGNCGERHIVRYQCADDGCEFSVDEPLVPPEGSIAEVLRAEMARFERVIDAFDKHLGRDIIGGPEFEGRQAGPLVMIVFPGESGPPEQVH